jgi:hypothetical protein
MLGARGSPLQSILLRSLVDWVLALYKILMCKVENPLTFKKSFKVECPERNLTIPKISSNICGQGWEPRSLTLVANIRLGLK